LEGAGRSEPVAEEEPWPDPITDIGAVLDAVVAELRRYVVAPAAALSTTALWAVQAHVLHREDLGVNIAPRLAIQSPMMGCGKTTLLEALSCVVPRPNMVGSTTPAALFRRVHAVRPTLLIDEADLLVRKDGNPELMQILNSGHRRSAAWAERTEKTTDGQFSPERFSTFTGIAFAGIKRFPETLQDRCVVIALRRATRDEAPEHLTDGESPILFECRRKIARWVKDLDELPRIDRPKELLNRLGDNWYVMRQIATLAGGEWPTRAFEAATQTVDAPEEQNRLAALLGDIWQAFAAKGVVRMATRELVDALNGMEETPWPTVNFGKPIDDYYLREHLKALLPQTAEARLARKWKNKAGDVRGYAELHFEDAWRRYLGRGPPSLESRSKDYPEEGETARKTPHTPSAASAPSAATAGTSNISDTCNAADTAADDPGQKASAAASAAETTVTDQRVSGNGADAADAADAAGGRPPFPRAVLPRGAEGRRKRGGEDLRQ
jgi:hypothetical protein